MPTIIYRHVDTQNTHLAHSLSLEKHSKQTWEVTCRNTVGAWFSHTQWGATQTHRIHLELHIKHPPELDIHMYTYTSLSNQSTKDPKLSLEKELPPSHHYEKGPWILVGQNPTHHHINNFRGSSRKGWDFLPPDPRLWSLSCQGVVRVGSVTGVLPTSQPASTNWSSAGV